jgi:hypothetical protein
MIQNDPNETPEHMIERIKRRRTGKLVITIVGLVGALTLAIGVTALMFADEPTVPDGTAER